MQKLAVWLFLFLAVSGFQSFNHADSKVKIKWMSLPDAEKAMKKVPKPILIDLYTDWCGWCKVMDKKTYDNEKVAAYLQENFYPVKLNAESRDSISWAGKTFGYNKQYRINELAIYLTGGDLSFPTTIFIADEKSGPQSIAGYLKPADLEPLAKYFGEGHFGKTSFQDFQKNYKNEW